MRCPVTGQRSVTTWTGRQRRLSRRSLLGLLAVATATCGWTSSTTLAAMLPNAPYAAASCAAVVVVSTKTAPGVRVSTTTAAARWWTARAWCCLPLGPFKLRTLGGLRSTPTRSAFVTRSVSKSCARPAPPTTTTPSSKSLQPYVPSHATQVPSSGPSRSRDNSLTSVVYIIAA